MTSKEKLRRRLAATKMTAGKYKYFGLTDELKILRKNQTAIMEFFWNNN